MCEKHSYKWTFVFYTEYIPSIVVILCQVINDILNYTYLKHCVVLLNILFKKTHKSKIVDNGSYFRQVRFHISPVFMDG